MTITQRSHHAGEWMVEFRRELEKSLTPFLAEGWTFRLDARSCMVHLLDPTGRGRAAVALPDGHVRDLPQDVAHQICRITTRLAMEAGMERSKRQMRDRKVDLPEE